MFETVLRQLEPFGREFSRHGKQVYLVGGAVRNLLLGRPVQDFDFTTDALPSEVQGYFRKVLPTGLQHGTVTVLFQGQSYEVTTFRVDGDYTDGRRPDGVTFTPSLEEDLKRRDFTINAMALNLVDGSLADPHGGREDLRKKVLRAIGDPGKRFDEDALRLLRLFRFAAQLGFEIDASTLAAVAVRRARLAAVSRERIHEELVKAMAGSQPQRAWGPLAELHFLTDLFGPLAPRPLTDAELDHMAALAPDLRWSFWLTLACGSRSLWEESLKALTFSKAEVTAALGPSRVWEFHGQQEHLSVTAKAVVEAWGARDRIVPGIEYLAALESVGYWKDETGLVAELRRIQNTGEPVFLTDLALGGKDLLAAGVQPGPKVGQVLHALQKLVWAQPNLNRPDELRRLVQSLR